ncbi:MAG: protein-L-isoaspartate O-methyltransferase [Pseudomonadota bacterium]|nr:protein-L-isoaspartate O-methyltransferase [Pseudomonadota bacterium]
MIETTMTQNASADSAIARRAMIDSQLRTSGVNEEYVLARMIDVPREDFLPADKQPLAYIDRSIALAEGALASPLFYGKAVLEAAPVKEDRVLIVENGTTYLSALIAPLVERVEVASAADAAEGVVSGDYSLIVIDGAIERLPDILANALAEDGRIVTGMLERGVTRLATGRKVAGTLVLQPVEDLGIPVLPAFNAPKQWTFS